MKFFVKVDNAKVYSGPYFGCKTVKTLTKGTGVTVTEMVLNASDKTWYKLSDGYWIYLGDVAQKLTVNYNANGGSGAPSSQKFLSGNSIKISSSKPTRVGYVFKGWGTSKTAKKVSYKSGSSYKFTKNMTLYAIWEKCTEHNYKNNGGICKKCGFEYTYKFTEVNGRVYVKNENGVAVYSRPYSEKSKKVRTEKYKKVVSIVGYCKNQKGETWYKLHDNNWVCSSNVTRQYIVTYDANNGIDAPKPQKFLSGKSVTISKTKPTLSGYIFLGWGTSKNATEVTYKSGAKYSKKSDITLYAVWSRNGVDPATEIIPVKALSLSELERKYANNEKAIDASLLPQKITYCNAEGRATGYYVAKNGCTWYAIARYNYVNKVENQLKFSRCGGNANEWVNTIDKTCFDVKSTSDLSVIKSNSIGVSTVSSVRGDTGVHVVYVEAVNDGFVYYSEGSYSKPTSTYGYVKRKTVEDFAKEYENIISAKLQ